MISLPRKAYNNGFFHVMVQGLNKEYIFDRDEYKQKYINLLKKYNNKYDVLLLAYCIMDNHAHILIYVDNINEMSMFMQNINSKFALYYNKNIGRVGYVFRGRFNAQHINSKGYLLRCLNYIHLNPVKANMKKHPGDYKYSTYNDYINRTGIVNDKVLNKIFETEENYLDAFLRISDKEFEIMDIDREEKNLKIAIELFLNKNKTTLKEIRHNKELLNKFCLEIVAKKKYKQIKVAELLSVNVSTISRVISKEKNKKG